MSRAKEIEIQEGELKRLEIEEHHLQKQRRIQVNRAKTYEELVALEKQMGYKKGWAFHRWNWRKKITNG